jgi:hypothetical protein
MAKICYVCKRLLKSNSFYKHKSRADGLRSECKSCHKAWRKANYHSKKQNNKNIIIIIADDKQYIKNIIKKKYHNQLKIQ